MRKRRTASETVSGAASRARAEAAAAAPTRLPQDDARQARVGQAWLARFGEPGSRESPIAAERIRYVLTAPLEQGVRVLRLEAQVQHPLPQGGWSTPKRPNVERLLSSYDVPAYAAAGDITLFHLLTAGANRFYAQDPLRQPLSGQLAHLLLQLLSDLQRCHVGSASGPLLNWQGERELQLDWRGDHKGMRPFAFIGDDCEAIPVDVPLWLDLRQGGAGRLIAPCPPASLPALLQAPELPASQWVLLANQQPGLWQKTGLQLPEEVLSRTLDGAPWPVLAISRLPDAAGDGLLLRPSFEYAGVSIAPYPQQRLQPLPGGQVQQRDLQLENHLLAGLPGTPAFLERAVLACLTVAEADQLILGVPAMLTFWETSVPALQAAGWSIQAEAVARSRVIDADDWWAQLDEQDGWFGVDLGVLVGGERLSLLPLLVNAIRQAPDDFALERLAVAEVLLLPAGMGRYLRLPAARLRPILQALTELFDAERDPQVPLRLSPADAVRLPRLTALPWQGGERLRQLADNLADLPRLAPVAAVPGFTATLRPYQQYGVAWMQFLRQSGLHGVLADDMGLGKTIQALAHLQAEKAAGRLDQPCLIVAPTSLMFNWQREAALFAPDLRVLLLHGTARKMHYGVLADYDVVLTTYPLLSRDSEVLKAQRWHLLMLDEAQAIKNPRAQSAQIVRELEVRHRLCLTGTPVENHLGELWALFDFLLPGFLGSERQFATLFRTPIEKQGDGQRAEWLRQRVAPFLLRRTKEDVATELPPKTEMIRMVAMQEGQRDLYETIRLALSEQVQQEIAARGLPRSQLLVLDALLKLRQVCCDPRLISRVESSSGLASAKLQALLELLGELLQEGRRILVFSQFTRMLSYIEAELRARGIDYAKLTGQTRDRATPVTRFQNGEVAVFLISLKAGGVGLNLTAADTVIHYDPWWNPAVEDQATDRAYRIGQDKPVFVYKLICAGSVEEKMLLLKDAKKSLAANVYGQTGQPVPGFGQADLDALFAPLTELDDQ
ncbi:DEAD/DEAH box helicase [Chitinilyticum piscinae]|uniref:DEAD/DEAH box helicase n=1 Tax=Chitinilyticum piscinae TaxID=2866724 RepID=A0A8J7K0B4_9NEIS|nr:DEAD/DEAH box helicase [Chitinilyticum piscinae]MBE9607766.1 DEAD/DEAH box helicase [Chitinilyticum piscinae]